MKKNNYRRRSLLRRMVLLLLVLWMGVSGVSFLYRYFLSGTEGQEREGLVSTFSGSEGQERGGFLADFFGTSSQRSDDIQTDRKKKDNWTIDLSSLYSPYAVLMDPDTGEILAEHNGQTRIYPASLTKIMTAVLAVETIEDMEEEITLPSDIFPKLYAEGASMAGFQPGETASVRDLLYGVLLPSGAECCLALAYRIDGTEEAFVNRMNQKAAELGLKNTHFENSTGLHDPEHYSTVEDIARLLRYALKNETFQAAFTSSRYSVGPSPWHPDGFTFYSTMFQSLDSAQVPGGRILGGKTGYTPEAGLCLASFAEIENSRYILVTAKADGSHQTKPYHILDAVRVYSQIGSS